MKTVSYAFIIYVIVIVILKLSNADTNAYIIVVGCMMISGLATIADSIDNWRKK